MAIAQDPIFSQYYNTPLQINPALTGNTFTPKVAVNYRNQYSGWPNAYTTYTASYDQFLEKWNVGLGAYVLTDNAGNGSIISNKLGLDYAYSLEMRNNNFIKIGLETAFLQTRINWDALLFGNQIGDDGTITPGGTVIDGVENVPEDVNKIVFDLAVGGVYFNKNFHVGLAVKHLNSSNLQFVDTGKEKSILGIPLRFVGHVGGQIEIESMKVRRLKSYWSPQLLFVSQGPFQQINIGSNINYANFHAGLWYRNLLTQSDALIVSLGYEIGLMKAMYSFDMTISGVSLDQGGAHELSLLFLFGQKEKKQNYNDCFEIFR